MRDRRPPRLDPADEVDAGDPLPERSFRGGIESLDLEDIELVSRAALVPFGLKSVDRVPTRNAVDLENEPILRPEPALPAAIRQRPGLPAGERPVHFSRPVEL